MSANLAPTATMLGGVSTKVQTFEKFNTEADDSKRDGTTRPERRFILHIVRGDMDKIEKAIEKDPFIVNTVDIIWGSTPLHFAVKSKNYDLAEFLLEKNHPPSSPNKQGFTPLHEAHKVGDEKMLEILFKYKADKNAISTAGQAPSSVVSVATQLDRVGRQVSYKKKEPLKSATSQASSNDRSRVASKGKK